MARTVTVGGKVYTETSTRMVKVGGKVYVAGVAAPGEGFKAAWARGANQIIGGGNP